ncbi:CheR family methyltransferase [Caulobacter henricii]|uniref:protein-glutamate O-methyltransferase n=1 Tax=Caulobacter henricii TaxID=69395 RepID=A0A0P0NWA9_9CAUL|nr:protein-glutamate O-methyltransferase CheR [Caulobacter henricii]ALL11966.1 chemotaxis protein CheR [Caulobacter henricii]
MTSEDMELLAALGRARAGLHIDVDKTYVVESRLAPLARREGFDSIDALMATLRSKREERLIWAVIEALTFNETQFFRDRAVFAHLRDTVLPTLSRARRDQPIRLWSAACSTGQEVYSLAMAAGDCRDVEPGAKFEFFGSDLSERCLEKAQSGLYTQFEVQRGLPIAQLVKHFANQDDTWEISPRIRQSVRWKRINLLSDLSALGRFDVILLRHVLDGLEPSYHGRIIESLTARLADDGVLVLGPDDALPFAATELFEASDQAGVFVRRSDHQAEAAA